VPGQARDPVELDRLVGCGGEHVAHHAAGLGWVETHRRELVVTDLDALRTYAR
jgi:hypothetical protein